MSASTEERCQGAERQTSAPHHEELLRSYTKGHRDASFASVEVGGVTSFILAGVVWVTSFILAGLVSAPAVHTLSTSLRLRWRDPVPLRRVRRDFRLH